MIPPLYPVRLSLLFPRLERRVEAIGNPANLPYLCQPECG